MIINDGMINWQAKTFRVYAYVLYVYKYVERNSAASLRRYGSLRLRPRALDPEKVSFGGAIAAVVLSAYTKGHG